MRGVLRDPARQHGLPHRRRAARAVRGVAGAAEPTGQEPASELAARGRSVLETTACASCHTVVGTSASGDVGPDLTHVASRDRIAAETIPNDIGHMADWISNSQTVKPGNLMPPQPLSPQDLRAVVTYLQGLE
ncbi:cytochrome c family protein [Pseudonocardia sp. MH-G8]|uniref:c-type cytochrome n=1 Tax=Pseudonocardia sp. MH-G8 TaxID=1854588 RepID=UPI000BA16F5D|nr:cytochrome c [Pseudonocardia sp. MH-G8]OZM76370.1 hypothetical protein CFP66_41235 [Pseudonocardia sp. MH-G8]